MSDDEPFGLDSSDRPGQCSYSCSPVRSDAPPSFYFPPASLHVSSKSPYNADWYSDSFSDSSLSSSSSYSPHHPRPHPPPHLASLAPPLPPHLPHTLSVRPPAPTRPLSYSSSLCVSPTPSVSGGALQRIAWWRLCPTLQNWLILQCGGFALQNRPRQDE